MSPLRIQTVDVGSYCPLAPHGLSPLWETRRIERVDRWLNGTSVQYVAAKKGIRRLIDLVSPT